MKTKEGCPLWSVRPRQRTSFNILNTDSPINLKIQVFERHKFLKIFGPSNYSKISKLKLFNLGDGRKIILSIDILNDILVINNGIRVMLETDVG